MPKKKSIFSTRRRLIDSFDSTQKSELAKAVQTMARTVNSRLYRLEKSGVKIAKNTAYSRAQFETGKEKPRFSRSLSKLEKMDFGELKHIANQLNQLIRSKSATVRGMRELIKEREETTNKTVDTLADVYNIDDKGRLKEFLENGGGELLGKKYAASDIVFDDYARFTKNNVISNREFLYRYNRFVNSKRPDYAKFERQMTQLYQRRENGRSKRK